MNVYVSNTNMLQLFRLKSAVENIYIDDADVTVTVVDDTGAEVAGQTWPLTLDPVSGGNGDYVGILSETIEFVPNTAYTAVIEADAGTNRFGHWEIRFIAKTRSQ